MNQVKPNAWHGALIGALATPALMAVFYIGEQLAGLPFVPFDFFNWIARILPGPVITFGIDRMVDTLILVGLGSDLDSAAKIAEQTMALGFFIGIGIVSGALFFFILNKVTLPAVTHVPGVVMGAIFAFVMGWITLITNVSAYAPAELQIMWIALIFIGYGMTFSWGYNALMLINNNPLQTSTEVRGVNRREFLVRVGGATAFITVAGTVLGNLLVPQDDVIIPPTEGIALTDSAGNPLPNANASVQPAPGTRLEYTPLQEHYRIDILSGGLPNIPADYTLPITGLVANPVQWSLDEIRAMPATNAFITMSCISNRIGGSLISTTKWTGVSFQHILDQIQPSENAQALKITGADSFDEYLDLDLIRNDDRIMLAYAFDDQPLPLRNGYPLRIHIPDRYGMKQPKWITSIEVVERAQSGYWVRRGWSAEAIVNATSVIDTVAVEEIYADRNGQQYVPIGGIAWAGDRQIARVEVRVDNGEWVEAQLRDTLSERAWVIWRYDFPFSEGAHNFEVRCFEAPRDGQSDPILQPTDVRGTRPDGATGIHSQQAFVRQPEAQG